ncbi:MAG: lipoate protein ligase C-terminal domain-containing protein [Nitratireductor sp.]
MSRQRLNWQQSPRPRADLSSPEWTNLQGRKLVDLGVKISAGTHLTESAHKAPGGMMRVHLLGRDGRIGNLMISGDFTCLPPDGIDRICAGLAGTALEQEAIAKAADSLMKELSVEMPGISGTDIATAVTSAAASGD